MNEHNGLVPRDHWIEDWERQRVIDYFDCHPLDGYRRLTFMMLDEDVVALSPSTTYRVLSKAGRLDRWNGKPSKKGTGFVSTAPTLAYGYLVLESGRDVLLPVLVSGCESGGGSLGARVDDGSGCGVHFGASKGTVRIISDNGPQYIAKTSRRSSASQG